LSDENQTENEKPNQANLALQIAMFIRPKFELFLDQFGQAYAWPSHDEEDMFDITKGAAIPLRSRTFRSVMVSLVAEEMNKLIGTDTVNMIISLLEADCMRYERKELALRYVMRPFNDGEARICVDMSNGDMLSVSREGVNVEKILLPIFRRYPSSCVFSVSKVEESERRKVINQLLDLWNFGEGDRCLLTGFIGASMVPNIPHSILFLVGHQGSAKTTLTQTIRQIIDPSMIDSIPVPKSEDDFMIVLSHNYLTPIDNVNKLKDEYVDVLCRAATGTSAVKRELYTDQEEVVLSVKHVVVINATNDVSLRGDYIDRLLRIELRRIPEARRKTEEEVKAAVEPLLPKVRWAFLSAVSEAMRHISSVKKELSQAGLPRMADFVVWGEAICRALGFEPGEFYLLYKERASDTQRIAVEADEIAQLIVRLVSVSKDNYWEGSPAELLAYIRMLNDQFKVVPEKLLPQAPNTLMKKVNLLATDLLDTERIEISQKKVAKGKRLVIIRKLPDQSLDTTFNGGNDDNSPPPVVSPAGEVRKVPPLPPPEPLSRGVAIPDKSTATQPPPATRTATPDDQHETDAGGGRGDRGDTLPTVGGSREPPNQSLDTTDKSENNIKIPRPVPGSILTVCSFCGQIKPCQWQDEGANKRPVCEDCFSKEISKGKLK
jgi:energy-coupling factor transporter ATP-binding protein EcfA2